MANKQNLINYTEELIDVIDMQDSCIINSVEVDSENFNDEIDLQQFLQTINMESLFETLKAANVTYRSLPYITNADLTEAIPHLGLRAEFRSKLVTWRKTELGVDNEPSKVQLWIDNNDDMSPSSSFTNNKNDLKTLINSSPKGRDILKYAAESQKLTCQQREDIVNIIIEDVIYKNTVLYPNDFQKLTAEICSLFPSENNMKDFYYIPRKGKTNAGGKLYSKYRNKCAKKRKLMGSTPSFSPTTSQSSDIEHVEYDESISVALKNTLNRDSSNWEEVCDKWKKTYHMRQNDIKNLTSLDFLKAWSKLSDSRGPELINIDFDAMYPKKGHLLFSKWELFKQKIKPFYDIHVHNEYCKQLQSKITSSISTDSEDYIYTLLLNAVLPSPARFKNEMGKRNKRVTIVDSQESFVLRLTCINDYERQINTVINKYYSAGLTIQPFIIVEGLTDADIKGFYVYFNSNLLKLNSFIECLDICFKIFHTLSLKYPEACEQPWQFIQKFFYDIYTQFDLKSVNITSLISFLNTNN
ncbi:uncharacterized protein LOC135953710 [Calliphora vicina]|uniref:uncharacterized protein LOC135953710 n=1 Tax=Calliphora vicina TaxID=7373 RepID=UPI00325A6445